MKDQLQEVKDVGGKLTFFRKEWFQITAGDCFLHDDDCYAGNIYLIDRQID